MVEGLTGVLNAPQQGTHNQGTKAAPHYHCLIPAGESVEFRLRMSSTEAPPNDPFGNSFAQTFQQRIAEADEFSAGLVAPGLTADEQRVLRQANAGLLWTKQFYHYVVPK